MGGNRGEYEERGDLVWRVLGSKIQKSAQIFRFRNSNCFNPAAVYYCNHKLKNWGKHLRVAGILEMVEKIGTQI